MNVKAQGLLNAAKYVEERFGQLALRDILQACTPAVRETYVSSLAINWHPVEELCEFVDVAEKYGGGVRGRLAHDIGAAGARANMKGTLLRIAFYVGRPEYMMTRAASLWRQFNDEGQMDLLSIDAHLARIEVRGIVQPRLTFCHIINGWCAEVARALHVVDASAHHVECRAKGGTRCLYDVRGLFAAGAPRPGA